MGSEAYIATDLNGDTLMDELEHTCIGDRCPFYQKCGLNSARECPNYIEIPWMDANQRVRTTRDCAPKRTLLLHADMAHQIVAIRGEINRLQHSIAALAKATEMLATRGKNERTDQETHTRGAITHRIAPGIPCEADGSQDQK